MKNNFKTTLKYAVATFAGALILCAATKYIASWFGVELHDQNTLELLKSFHGRKLAMLVAYAVIGAPVVEELFARGLLFRLPSWFVGWKFHGKFRAAPAVFAVLSSIVFVAVHYGKVNPFPDNAFIGLFYFALMQCRLYAKTGLIVYPILNHFLFNCANLACVMAFGG